MQVHRFMIVNINIRVYSYTCIYKTMCPIVTFLPIVNGKPSSVCSVHPSCTLLFFFKKKYHMWKETCMYGKKYKHVKRDMCT